MVWFNTVCDSDSILLALPADSSGIDSERDFTQRYLDDGHFGSLCHWLHCFIGIAYYRVRPAKIIWETHC